MKKKMNSKMTITIATFRPICPLFVGASDWAPDMAEDIEGPIRLI
jgi:hypothetical protein